jgi:hypothetical protein
MINGTSFVLVVLVVGILYSLAWLVVRYPKIVLPIYFVLIVGLVYLFHLWKPSISFTIPGPGHLDYAYDLAGGYELSRTSAYQANIVPKDGYSPGVTPMIPANIAELAWDNRFILATQQPLKADADNFEKPIPGMTNFWILDTKKPEVLGPMNIEQFCEKRIQLGITNSLILKDKNQYEWPKAEQPRQ